VTATARAFYGDFVRTFGNVLFAVSLFVVWGLLTLVGVVVDQGQDPSSYFQSYAAPIARAILRLNFDNVYHSPWYVGIIGLILLSLAVCTFKRVIPARLPPLHPVSVDKIPLHASFDVDGEVGDVLRRARLADARAVLRRHRMELRGQGQLGAPRRTHRAYRLRDRRGRHDALLGARLLR
jgi:cytochrome c biogenesis protein ResB